MTGRGRVVSWIASGCVLLGAVLLAWWALLDRAGEPAESGRGCPSGPPEELRAEVLEELPHDPAAFTQGLAFDAHGNLFESTGIEGSSAVRQLDPATGEVVRSVPLDGDLFGEGLAVGLDGEIVQLTWTEGRALRWDPEDLEPLGEFDYGGEGWGLARIRDGAFAMSDGSDALIVRDVEDFGILDRVEVGRDGGGADMLNELEWDGEHLWANRWRTDEIVRIDLECSRIDAVLDASELHQRAAAVASSSTQSDMDVLNGIAHVDGDVFLVTGKRWPVMFRVRIVPT